MIPVLQALSAVSALHAGRGSAAAPQRGADADAAQPFAAVLAALVAVVPPAAPRSDLARAEPQNDSGIAAENPEPEASETAVAAVAAAPAPLPVPVAPGGDTAAQRPAAPNPAPGVSQPGAAGVPEASAGATPGSGVAAAQAGGVEQVGSSSARPAGQPVEAAAAPRAASSAAVPAAAPPAAASAGAEIGSWARSAAATARGAGGSAAAAGVDPRRVERSVDLLVPEMRVRLERVVTRMQEEHGHRVDVVETLRHQVRQNFLFEQGRSRPGPVVTWTRHSNHSEGRAVDVMIDGSYGNPVAFSRLARIASEEGLRTLGARDPGHLELPRGIGGSRPEGIPSHASVQTRYAAPAPASPLSEPAAARGGAPIAVVAQVAAVATPAAPVAAPVAVAAPTPAATAPLAEVASVAVPAAGGAGRVRERGREERQAPSIEGLPLPDRGRTASAMFAVAETMPTSAAAASAPAAGGLGAGAAARIAHLLDLQTAAPLRPLQQVLLRLDGPDGQDRIRLDLRGSQLGGSIALSDPAAVQKLDARLGELQRALEQRGLESESLRVRGTSPRADIVELTRAAAGLAAEAELQRTAVRATADTALPRERSAHPDPQGNRDHPEPREGSPDPRHRSRREHKGEQHT
jgi:hypothetical protein